MKQLLLLAVIVLLTACSKTGVQIKNETDITLYSVEVSYYDKDGSLLNSYTVSDSIPKGLKSKIMDVENRADYAKIKFDLVPEEALNAVIELKDSLVQDAKYRGIDIDPSLEYRMNAAIDNVKNKEVTNKYYISEKEITNIVINNTNKFK